MQGLLGRKIGMTKVFSEDGDQVPVTVLELGPCSVLQRKTKAVDGYDAVQCGFEDQKEQRATKSAAGHCKKAGTGPKRAISEFPVEADSELKAGDVITASIFEDVSFVDIVGTSKGRGFQGVVKRHGMAGGRKTHGSHSHRQPGSIGASAYPGRVAKGKRMPGHMGNSRVTTQNLRVVQVVPDDNMLLVRGAVPGPKGGLVRVTVALKKPGKAT